MGHLPFDPDETPVRPRKPTPEERLAVLEKTVEQHQKQLADLARALEAVANRKGP